MAPLQRLRVFPTSYTDLHPAPLSSTCTSGHRRTHTPPSTSAYAPTRPETLRFTAELMVLLLSSRVSRRSTRT